MYLSLSLTPLPFSCQTDNEIAAHRVLKMCRSYKPQRKGTKIPLAMDFPPQDCNEGSLDQEEQEGGRVERKGTGRGGGREGTLTQVLEGVTPQPTLVCTVAYSPFVNLVVQRQTC